MKLSSSALLPTHRLTLAIVFCLACAFAALALALRAPWLGLALAPHGDGSVRVLGSGGPSAGVPAGATLVHLRAGERRVELQGTDLIEEPDLLEDYPQMDAFFERQAALAALLAGPQLELGWRDARAGAAGAVGAGGAAAEGAAAGELRVTEVRPERRPLSSLPVVFWFQLAVSTAGCLIASWVWALRPGEWGARMFAVTGALFPLFAMPAAVYSSRESALDGGLFRALSAMNHGMALMFGAALVAVFLCSPRPLVRPRWLLAPFAFYGVCWLAEVLRIAPDLNWGNRYPVMSEMLLALALGAVQWRRSRGEPVARAALRWFILSMLLGSGLFIVLVVATASLGWLPPVSQGYAFGFFLFIYVGIALGLGRYRLFDLDAWAYRLLGWLGAALAILGLDALFVAMLDWSATAALAVSLWVGTLAYLPLRHWLWQRVSARQAEPQVQDLLPDVVRIAFEPVAQVREKRWDELLQRVFAPLEMVAQAQAVARGEAGADRAGAARTGADPAAGERQARLEEDGLALLVPQCARIGARRLRYPGEGARLFGPRDRGFVDALASLMDQAEASRAAQERGAAEERQRIARDVHDDVGARLLMLIHHAPTPAGAELARAAMQDLRTALGALDIHPVPLEHALADWRAEAGDRCEAAGVALRWSSPRPRGGRWLSARQKAVLERCLRETITNALKHAAPTRMSVQVALEDRALVVHASHDGKVTAPQAWVRGRGLRGMAHRLQEVGAALEVSAREGGGTRSSIRMPLEEEDPHA